MLKNKLSKNDINKLENILVENNFENDFFNTELIEKLNIDKSLYDLCVEYLKRAIKIPREDMLRVLNEYDNSHPKMDEVKLINDLSIKYQVNREIILKRIREVRILQKF